MSELGVGLESGLRLKNLTVKSIIILNHKVPLVKTASSATGPSNHSDWVSIHRLSNKKA